MFITKLSSFTKWDGPNGLYVKIYTEAAPKSIQSISCDVRLFVCVCVCPILEVALPDGQETSGQRAYP